MLVPEASLSARVAPGPSLAEMIVLEASPGPRLGLTATRGVCRALRRALMSRFESGAVPRWLSGHEADGQPSSSADGHLAIVPLAHVGRREADGHLLGVGLVLPRSTPNDELAAILGPALWDQETGKSTALKLRLGRLGEWSLRQRDGFDEHPKSLNAETWGAGLSAREYRVWSSVTPVVLDRFPKADRSKDAGAWRDEAAVLIERSCERVGLPRPAAIDIGTTSWVHGVPRAVPKRRPARGHGGLEAALGDGFPPGDPAKGRNAARPQVHVRLEFEESVRGPVLVGAGRFGGYGFFRPMRKGERSE